ncbi:MAG: hypothetical protein QM656_17730 [Paracoccaceae bacterium]
MSSRLRLAAVAAAALFSAAVASSAFAATVNEADVAGGFSNNWTSATAIAAGTTSVSGTISGGAGDVLELTGLDPSATSLSFSFSLASIGSGYSNAGGSIYYSYSPFPWAGGGTYGTWFGVTYDPWNATYSNGTSTATLNLGSGFGGTLYLAFAWPWGATTNYSFDVPVLASTPVEEPTSAVPLPAGVLLMGTALAGLGGLRLRRRIRA